MWEIADWHLVEHYKYLKKGGRKGRRGWVGKKVGQKEGERKDGERKGEEERGLVRNDPQLTLIERQRMARWFPGRGPFIWSPPAWVPLGYLGLHTGLVFYLRSPCFGVNCSQDKSGADQLLLFLARVKESLFYHPERPGFSVSQGLKWEKGKAQIPGAWEREWNFARVYVLSLKGGQRPVCEPSGWWWGTEVIRLEVHSRLPPLHPLISMYLPGLYEGECPSAGGGPIFLVQSSSHLGRDSFLKPFPLISNLSLLIYS